jgi:hypothetical protein
MSWRGVPMSKASLRTELVKRTRWSKQTLSAKVRQLQRISPMDTSTAQAVLAHERGIKVHRYLEPAVVAEVQRVLPLLNGTGPRTAGGRRSVASTTRTAAQARTRAGQRAQSSRTRKVVFTDGFEYQDPFLSEERLREAREMAAVYPMLYVLENSMREVVNTVMAEKYGTDWWETELTTGKAKTAKTNADGRRIGENNRRWHQRRGARPIDYTDLGELGDIILSKRTDFFPDVLGGGDTLAWFEQFMRELEPSRNVVCHMNPLSTHNLSDVSVKLHRWREATQRWVDERAALGRTATK